MTEKKLILVVFTQPSRCGPCAALRDNRIVDDYAAKHPEVQVVWHRFDSRDKFKKIAAEAEAKRLKVSAIPCLIWFKAPSQGTPELHRHVAYIGPRQIETAHRAALAKASPPPPVP